MLKYYYSTEKQFLENIKEAEDKNMKITYKNIKPFEFPCKIPIDQIWGGQGKDRKVIEIQIYNREDFIKEGFNNNDLLYSEVEFISETDITFGFGKAFIKGIVYKQNEGHYTDEIEYMYMNYIGMNSTGDEFSDKVNDLVGTVMKDKLYPDEILKISQKHTENKIPNNWEFPY